MPSLQADLGAWVRAYQGEAVLLLVGLSVILLVAVIVQGVRLGRMQRRFQALLSAPDLGNVAEVLENLAIQVKSLGPRVEALEVLSEALQEAQRRCLQHVGVVRFDAFEDVGGHQSSAIALMDDYRDGVVISTIYSRADARVYAKVIRDGQSEHPLTEEEQEAIELARMAVREKAVVARRPRSRR